MNTKTWFRFYHEVLDDPKVQKLPLATFKNWVSFLCLASRFNGQIPPVSDIAFILRVTEADASVMQDELIHLELLDSKAGKVFPHNWKDRQFQSDSSTARVKRFRQRFRNGGGNAPDQSRAEQKPIALSGFERFWVSYPRKIGRAAALKVWHKLNPNSDLQEKILAKVDESRNSAQWRKDNGQFIPHPATWLNQGRWDDVLGIATTPQAVQVVF